MNKSQRHANDDSQWSSPRIVVAAITLLASVAVATLVGWWLLDRPPIVERDNLRLIQLLHTAVSSQNRDYVDGVGRAVQARRQEGGLSDAEFNALDKILAVARSGDWEGAQRMTFRLEQGQLNRSRPAVAPKPPEHLHSPEEREQGAAPHSH